jgi:hypothetical protein
LVLRWNTAQGAVKHATVVCSVVAWSYAEVIAAYDDRGACETEIQADKDGLKLERRRKKHLAAQEALILLTDLAHNLLAWAPRCMFVGEPLAKFGPLRLTEDVFSLPGRLFFCPLEPGRAILDGVSIAEGKGGCQGGLSRREHNRFVPSLAGRMVFWTAGAERKG